MEKEKWRRERERYRSEAQLASDHRGGKLAVMLMPGSSQPARMSLHILNSVCVCACVCVCVCLCVCVFHV